MTNQPTNTKNDIKVSVIVPVYNGEVHLRQCLDSICAQTLQEIEIICVDDGSTDSSYAILEEYAAADARFRLFRQQNKFAGAARNLGKANAVGEYLVFWDCDDFFAPKALEKLYNRAKKYDADICVCGAGRYIQDTGKLQSNFSGYLNPKYIPNQDVFNRLTNEDYILNFTNAAAWNKLYRREFVERIGLNFHEIRNANDVFFTMSALCIAQRITVVKESLVTYRFGQSNSLMGTVSNAPLTPIQTWIDLAEYLKQHDVFPERSYVNRVIANNLYSLRNIDSYNSFVQAVEYLQSGALEKMYIIDERDDDFYYVSWHCDFVTHLIHDTPSDLLAWLAHINYLKMINADAGRQNSAQQLKKQKQIVTQLTEEIDKQKDEVNQLRAQAEKLKLEREKYRQLYETQKRTLKELHASRAYRIGRIITWLPRKIKCFLKR